MTRNLLRSVFPVVLSSLEPPTRCGNIACTHRAMGALAWPDPSGLWIIRLACSLHIGHQPERFINETRPFVLPHPEHFTSHERSLRPLAYQTSGMIPCYATARTTTRQKKPVERCQRPTNAGLITLLVFIERPDVDVSTIQGRDWESFQTFREALAPDFSHYHVLFPLCPNHQGALILGGERRQPTE